MGLWVTFAVLSNAAARAVPDPSDPIGFFTVVADKMLRGTFAFGVTNIPVYSNGVHVYTPSVQRLLQLSANILDASNTNFFPSVFRPLFATDGSNDVFIVGYLQVTNVSGASDPQLSQPYDAAQLTGRTGTPITDSNGPVNVYGIPWIIGAKRGLPNFNQFYMVNQAQVTRMLEVTRTSMDPQTATYATNQMYVIGISNNLGISWWNSYSNVYPRPVTVFASDVLCETLTNAHYVWPVATNFTTGGPAPGGPVTINPWPGSRWTGLVPSAVPSTASFARADWGFTFLSPSSYNFNTGGFDPNPRWQTTTPPLPQLPQFGLLITNYLQAYLLDGSNVIDYVQLRSPISVGGLNQGLADLDYPQSNHIFFQWSTNVYGTGSMTPFGVMNQLYISGHPASPDGPTPAGLMPAGGQWNTAPTPMGDTTPSAEAAYFNGFFVPNFQYNGQTYVNDQLAMQAPYTPSRTVYSSFLLQANDPLVHYTSSDLNAQAGAIAIWQNGSSLNGNWYHSDDPSSQLPQPPQLPVKGRYQPWGASKQMASISGVDQGGYNLAFKDPLIWAPDYWSFPTNLTQSLAFLGQVHRGTPWQTFYLKSTNVLVDSVGAQIVGSNTWRQWTGDLDVNDAMLMAPVTDWRLAGLLLSLLNTNDPTQLFSVNDSNAADWQNLLGGLLAYSNSTPTVFAGITPQFTTYVMASDSPQASTIANAIVQIRTNIPFLNSPFFYSIGDVLATQTLSTFSPYLNAGSLTGFGKQQWAYGINDSAYEAIPAQLLPLLRPDSVGILAPTNGGWVLGFTGADGYRYILQSSADLVHWVNLSTNSPVQGGFNVPAGGGLTGQFFRTVLLP